MAQYQLNYSGSEIDTLLAKVENMFNLIYPVGAIYISTNSTSPATLFGGTWEQIQDKFLLASGSTYTAGGTGGSSSHTHTMEHTHTYAHTHTTPATTTDSHTLTVAEMPAHKHNFTNSYGYTGTDIPGCSISVSGSNNIVASPYHAYAGSSNNLAQQNAGGGGGHTHGQKGTTTNSQSTSTTSAASNATTSETSNLPPYLAVYVWKRTA